MPFYGVFRGREKGVFRSWEDTKPLVEGYPGAIYRKFRDRQTAVAFSRVGPEYKNVIDTLVCPTRTTYVVNSKRLDGNPSFSFWPVSSEPFPGESVTIPVAPSPVGGAGTRADGRPETAPAVAYCHGSWDGRQMTLAVWFGKDHPNNSVRKIPATERKGLGVGSPAVKAELMALEKALADFPDGCGKATVFTDSLYAVRCVRDYIPRWRETNFITTRGTKTIHAKRLRGVDLYLRRRDFDVRLVRKGENPAVSAVDGVFPPAPDAGRRTVS